MFEIIVDFILDLFLSEDSDYREVAGCITMVILVILVIILFFGGIYSITRLL